jgi:hypothetical protein
MKVTEKRAHRNFWNVCESPGQLHAWIQTYCGINIPRKSLCPHHDAPFDYVWHAYHEPARDVVVWAPRGGGKTRLGALATLLDLLHKPHCAARILAGSLEQSRKMWQHLAHDLARLEDACDFTLYANRVLMPDGANATVLSQSQRAVRGLRVQKLRCDEIELFDPKVWQAAQLVTKTCRDLRLPDKVIAGVVEVFSTMHKRWGLMRDIVDAAPDRNTRVIKWCILDVLERCPQSRDCNTCQLHPECQGRAKTECNGFFSIDDAIRMKGRVSKECWNAEMLCQRPATTGCVFPTFDLKLHVRDNIDAEIEYARGQTWLGIDFGFANPFVCLWIVKYPGEFVHVIDEYVQPGKIIQEHIAQIKARRERGEVRMVACDPAGSATNEQTAKSNVKLLEEAGYFVRKRGSHIQEGLEMVRARVMNANGETRLFIHSRCTQLIRAMGAYRYPETGKGETPLKDGENDHLIDALRYFFVNQVSHKCDQRPY